MRKLCSAGLLLMLLAAPAPVLATEEAPHVLNIPQLSAAPPMDAALGGSWKDATTFHLTHEGTYRKPAAEDTIVHVGMYGGFLFVAFEAVQHEPLVATQVTDGPGLLTGDAVMVHLWPNGLQGFAYWFATNLHGARDQFSSENSAYAPAWTAFGRQTPSGYMAILKVPLSAMHAQKGASWRAQFHRIVVASNSNYVWELDPEQASFIDGRYGGQVLGMAAAHEEGTRPRIQLYTLGEFSKDSTSRVGADFSLPVTGTTSIFGTAHPDFSNVEIDQQTISPTVFARRFAEVRPFFTQAVGNFNRQPDFNLPMSTLYTPAIPAFRDGYGVEGREGLVSFGAFDASGYARNDDAQAISLTDPLERLDFTFQRVGVDLAQNGFHDVVNDAGLSLFNPHSHLTFFANSARETGTSVTDTSAATYADLGTTYSTATSQVSFALQKMGPQFNPADGYANQPPGEPGIAGYTAYATHQFNYSPTSRVLDFALAVAYDRYHGPDGATNQADFSDQLRVDFKDQLTFIASQALSSLATCVPSSASACEGAFLPYNGSGFSLGYALNTAHPSSITYARGSYYHGALTSWQRALAIPVSRKAAISLEADDTIYASSTQAEPDATQWLERAGVNYQFSSSISLDAGVRRIIGSNPPFSFAPFGPSTIFTPTYLNATNLSAALHFFRGNNELYVVYGDPNRLATLPTLFVKYIRYVGAGKGT